MKFLLLILTSFILLSCNESAIRKSFSSADSLVIHFKDEQKGEVLKTVQTAEKKAIGRLSDFIDAPATQEFKCGYDGKMFFYKGDSLIQEVDFQMKNEQCRHFVFLLDGKLMSTRMNQEATDFLDALSRGLPTYY